MAGDINVQGYVWSDAQGWVSDHDAVLLEWHERRKALIPYEELPPIEERRQAMLAKMRGDSCPGPAAQVLYDETLYFSMTDQTLYCELCRRAVNQLVNSAMRWPNDISGYPGDATPTREEDEYGEITSRTRWLQGAGTDYR